MRNRTSRTHVARAAILLLLPVTIAAGEEYPALNATLLEHIPLGGFPSNPSSANDCWGYVSPGGREYALVGVRNAVAVVDITEASGPVIVGSISHTSSNWCDIRTFGSYAYAVNESGGGLDVIDLSQVDSGIVTLVQRVTEAGLSTCHNIAVNEDSGYLYLCAPNINQGRLVAMDLADPANPVIAGQFPIASGGVPHDAQVVSFDSGPYAGLEIAYCSAGTDGLEIYDVTNKAAMFKISEPVYPNQVFTHQAWLNDTRQYLYVNDELDGINETVIFDVSDVANPFVANTYSSGVPATDHNVFFHQGVIYEAEYRAGMRIFDASDPLNPVQVGWLDTYPADDSAGSGGAWGVYPFFPSGKVIISDKNSGLFVAWPGPAPINFDFPAGVPDEIDPAGETFLVNITAASGHALDAASPTLVYDFGAGAIETAMTPAGGDTFEAAFGAIPCGSFVQFHVRAATTAGVAIRSPLGAPCVSNVAIAAASSSPILVDEFEVDAGWTAGVVGDTAVAGIWTRVDPNASDAQPGTDHTPSPGTDCFVTGQAAANDPVGQNDVDEGVTTLLSPSLDLSGAEQVTISYWRWYHNSFAQIDGDEGTAPNSDVFTVQITDNGGFTWTTVETVGPAGPETAGGWFLHAFDVGSLVGLTANVRVRFVASDVGVPSIVEAAIDDVRVVSVTCSVCPADLDGSGDVGIGDLLALLAAWGPCPPPCPEDLDASGTVDIGDLLGLLASWGACP